MKYITRVLLLACLLCATPGAQASTLTFGSARDTTLYKSAASNGNSKGVGMFAGQDPGGNTSSKRGLIAFDVSAIPAGSTITSVELGLYFGIAAGSGGVPGAGSSPPQVIDVHRFLSNWVEGTSGTGTTTIGGTGGGFTVSAGEPTWNNMASPSTPWVNGPGGDYVLTASAGITVANPNTNLLYTWGSNSAMIADVQLWVNNPTQNFGWMLKANDENAMTSFRAFYTRDATANLRPVLTISFIPEPSTYVLVGLAMGCITILQFKRRQQSSGAA